MGILAILGVLAVGTAARFIVRHVRADNWELVTPDEFATRGGHTLNAGQPEFRPTSAEIRRMFEAFALRLGLPEYPADSEMTPHLRELFLNARHLRVPRHNAGAWDLAEKLVPLAAMAVAFYLVIVFSG